MLEQEILFYNTHLKELVTSDLGKYVLIKNNELIGKFNTFDDALSEGARRFGLVPFLIRQIQTDQEEINIPALTLGILNADITYPTLR